MGSFVYPEMYSLSMAYDAFDENGQLKDEGLEKRLRNLMNSFIEHTENFHS